MRITYLPLNRQRTFLFCQNITLPSVRKTPRVDEKMVAKAQKVWHDFETSDKNWKKTIVRWSNTLLERIPYEEWCLRTIPSIAKYQRQIKHQFQDELDSKHIDPTNVLQEKVDAEVLEPVKLCFPTNVLSFEQAQGQLRDITDKALGFHKKRAIWLLILLPFTTPIALIPVVPNLPAFYVMFRIYCHFTAYQGAKHLDFLLKHNQLRKEELLSLNTAYEHYSGDADSVPVDRIRRIFNSESMSTELDRALKQIEKKENK